MARSSRQLSMFAIYARRLKVSRIEDITAGMRRITLSGPHLGEHQQGEHTIPALHSTGFDDDVRLIFPAPGEHKLPEVPLDAEGSVIWDAHLKDLFRTYTVRDYNSNTGELVIDFARHHQGLAENWSKQATIGDELWVVGPKACRSMPTHRDWLLLAGDETALPAIGRCLAELPEQFPVVVVVEAATAAHRFQLDTKANAQITWVFRDQGQNFATALEQVRPPIEGPGYAWVAGEAAKLRKARPIVAALGISKEDSDFVGYWRDTSMDQQTGGYTILEQAHELTELAPGLVLRAAVQLGIFAAIEDGHNQLETLAAHLSIQPAHLARLLRYLESLQLIQRAETLRVTALGREFADPEGGSAEQLLTLLDRRVFSLMQLGEVLHENTPTQQSTWHAAINSERVEQERAQILQWMAPNIAEALGTHQNVNVLGPGRTALLDLVSSRPEAAYDALVLLDPGLEHSAEDLHTFFEQHDVPRVAIVTYTLDDAQLDEHMAEEDLVRMCTTGGHVPSSAQLHQLFADHGMRDVNEHNVGFGLKVFIGQR